MRRAGKPRADCDDRSGSGLVCALLARYSPGATVDERELNLKAGEETIAALRAQEGGRGGGLRTYFRGLAKGDLGYSESNNAPMRR